MPFRPKSRGATPAIVPEPIAAPMRSRIRPKPVEAAATTRAVSVQPAPEHHPNRGPDGSYIVGKNRPPEKTRFQPGVSGNPKGRPKGAKGIKTLTLEVLGARMPVKTATGERKMNAAEISLYKLRELAARNNLAAILAVLERWQRAVPDIVENTGPAIAKAAPPSETDRAIIDLFTEELRQLDVAAVGEAASDPNL